MYVQLNLSPTGLVMCVWPWGGGGGGGGPAPRPLFWPNLYVFNGNILGPAENFAIPTPPPPLWKIPAFASGRRFYR